MIGRRRPLARAAMVGGAGYMAGKHMAAGNQREQEQEARIQELEKASTLDPASTPALYALSQAYRKKGDTARAQALLTRVSTLNAKERGDDPDGELRRAVVRIVRQGTTAPRKTPAEQ